MFCTEFTLRLSSKQMNLESSVIPLSPLQYAFSNTGSQKMELDLWFSNCNLNKIQSIKGPRVCFSGYFIKSQRSSWNTKGWRQSEAENAWQKWGGYISIKIISMEQIWTGNWSLQSSMLWIKSFTLQFFYFSAWLPLLGQPLRPYSFFIHGTSAKAPRFLSP